MDATTQLATAIALAERQLQWIRDGELDRFIEGSPAHESSCRAVLGLPHESTGPALREGLRRLIGVNQDTADETTARMTEMQAKMSAMKRGQRRSAAYLATTADEGQSHFHG